MEGTKKIKSMSFHQYSWNSEVETTWISLIGWHHKTSTKYVPKYAELCRGKLYPYFGWLHRKSTYLSYASQTFKLPFSGSSWCFEINNLRSKFCLGTYEISNMWHVLRKYMLYDTDQIITAWYKFFDADLVFFLVLLFALFEFLKQKEIENESWNNAFF